MVVSNLLSLRLSQSTNLLLFSLHSLLIGSCRLKKNPSYSQSEWENDDESDWDVADGESTVSSFEEEADYPLR